MARRSWRNFDYLLLGVLVILAAYGVVMIYSATINTLGLEDAVRRQTTYVVVGTAVLLITASVDYRLLDILQQPIRFLVPLVLALFNVGLVIVWRLGQPGTAPATPTIDLFLGDVPAMLTGIALVVVVFAADRAWLEDTDLPVNRLLLASGVIVAAGAVYLALSRSPAGNAPSLSAYLQTGAVAVAYLVDCLTLRFSDRLRNLLYVSILALLGVVFLVGEVSGGAQRWLGSGAVQPSELSKILLIIVLAEFLADRDREGETGRFSTMLISLGLVAIPMLLIYLQPDLGTALSLGAIWLAMVWMANIPLRYMLLLGGSALAALPLAWLSLEGYMRERILLFLNPNSDPDAYFNVHQALVSIGSGGWTGKGLTHGSQSQLHFLRVRHTDFIFAVTAEELGILGAVVMIGLLFLLLWRILVVAERSRDTFGRLLCAGVAGLIFFQTAVNVGMNVGLMPVTGIPLPFVSYGGSSFLTLMVGIGLVESVAMRHKKLEFD